MSNPHPDIITARDREPLRFYQRVAIRWLQGIFRSFDRGQYQFNGNDSPSSELLILGKSPWSPNESEVRPAIVVIRGAGSWAGLGIGAGPRVIESRLSTGETKKTDLFNSFLAFHCLSRVGDESEHLAWIVSFWLVESISLLSKCGLVGLGTPQIGQVSPAPDALIQVTKKPEWMVCSCTVPFSHQPKWTSTPEITRTLKSVSVDLEDELGQIVHTVQLTRGE